MKKLKVVKGAKCMACLECVRACSTSFYKEFDPDKSCIQIVEKKGDAKPMVCVQCVVNVLRLVQKVLLHRMQKVFI